MLEIRERTGYRWRIVGCRTTLNSYEDFRSLIVGKCGWDRGVDPWTDQEDVASAPTMGGFLSNARRYDRAGLPFARTEGQ